MKRVEPRATRLLRLTRLFVLAACLACAPRRALAAEPGSVFIGYVYQSPPTVRWKMYTHVCHAFVTADEQGRLKSNRHVPSRELTTSAHAAGARALLSLGGWGWDQQFARMTASPPAEGRYVEAVMRLVDQFDYDGVDLDWEYPDTPEEVAGFQRLARTFRTQLDDLGRRKGRPMRLTMAASASPQTLRWLERDFLLETMDWIHVMTYDYAGSFSAFAGHHAPLYASSQAPEGSRQSVESTMTHLATERRIPADRLVVGIPLYGRRFSVAAPYASTAGAPPPSSDSHSYAELHQLQSSDQWRRQWDPQTKTPWLIAADDSSVICYDDAESVRLKTAWAMEQHFRGVFFWQVAGDRLPDGSNPLQDASRRVWQSAQARDDRLRQP
ncbi:MAG: glycoside hydrolase family 18 protein [Pirellulales bacterium]|nr:glycoside hydrolase family 18 protein [Pirellulales bacterium]